VFEVHGHENVFSWNITTALLVLAIHVPLLAEARIPRRMLWAWPIATGVLVATIRTFRSEPAPILASAAFAYLVLRSLPHLYRVGLVAALAGAVVVTQVAWNHWFDVKHEQARATVDALGGHAFPGPIRHYHHFWHPVWCGLGDFDMTRGYVWDDTKALAYAKPILEREYGEFVPASTFHALSDDREYWDHAHVYKKLPYDIPHYNEIIRDKVLGDIKQDPAWYAKILYRRVKRVLLETTPVRLTGWSGWLTIPGVSGLWFLPCLVSMWIVRARFFARLLLFTLPTTTTAVVVYSDRGMADYGVFHLVMAGILAWIALVGAGAALSYVRRRRRAA
jgi:hypothetical protein